MKRFSDVMSGKSWLVLIVGFYPFYLAVFRPSWVEFLVWCAVEFAAFGMVVWLDRRLFLRYQPNTASFFPEFSLEKWALLTSEEKFARYHSLIDFPRKRALFCVAISYIEMLPSALVVVFYWKHGDPNWLQFLKFLLTESIMYAYFYGALFIEFHDLVSRTLAELHARYDWSDVFERVDLKRSRISFEAQERLALGCIWALALIVQWTLIVQGKTSSRTEMAILILLTSCVALLQISRILYLGRSYFFRGLESLFQNLEHLDPGKKERYLPLHSSPQLARFEKIFNSMLKRLHSYDRELSRWVFANSEHSRYEALGEVSAYIVHELSTPLHVINFCIGSLKEDPSRIQDLRYLDQLTVNAERAVSLVNSLRAHVRNDDCEDLPESSSKYAEVHPHVMRLLEAQFSTDVFQHVKVNVAGEVWHLPSLNITLADLIHIARNLLSNSVANLRDFGVPNPEIHISGHQISPDKAVLGFRDNGTGLSAERYEAMTALNPAGITPGRGRKGLGLRLTRRMVERNGGNLRIGAPHEGHGTFLLLELKLTKGKTSGELEGEVGDALGLDG